MRSCTLANASTSSTRISAALEAGTEEAAARPAAGGRGGGGGMAPAAAGAGWPAQEKGEAGGSQHAYERCGCVGNVELIRQNGLQVGPASAATTVSRRFPPLCASAAGAATGGAGPSQAVLAT